MLHAKAHGHTHIDEAAGDEGDDFLIKAVEVGRANVAVRILARGYEHINQANMTLTIVDPFVIVAADEFFEGPTPFSPVSILPASSFNYKLRYVKQQEDNGIFYEDIPRSISSTSYAWSLAASTRGRGAIDRQGLFQSNLTAGLAVITVTDEKFPTNVASTTINVVEPFRVNLELADVTKIYNGRLDEKGVGQKSFQSQLGVKEWDDGQWILVEESIYLIKAFVFDENG